MKKKQLWYIIAGLTILNVITLLMLLGKPAILEGKKETVAEVGKESITRQQWLTELEQRYGQETLRDMVDQRVVVQMAEKYGIKLSDDAVERELTIYKAMYSSPGEEPKSEERWKQQIEYSLLLEELLTKDVKVSEDDKKAFYEQNKHLFDVPSSYHLSQIIVETKQEAESAAQELKDGSSFAALAMERSIDEFSANDGGDIGFVTEEDELISPEVITAAKSLKPKEWTEPVKTEDGYAIVYLHEKLAGKSYSFSEVENQIRRQIALEQMDIPVSARAFWNDAEVSWFYGETSKK
ncbi:MULTISPECIES: peptidyl-prolyl cis-trans isomerase [Mesobacillus]|uniref:peptidylprolyl isomerase n=2 Tax=Mesobacillus TaxID=2675231 RepID=A0A0D6ZBN8_9BACI|nr:MULTISPECIES: peptidyl-prolyl cis-trans isomerase [Mesobacillus]KIY22927.1 peptidylprolyl isomerase [Mesobacillus subterraneus]MDQ0414886.1 foldase protein PrsA [Mesobacillus stamsii]